MAKEMKIKLTPRVYLCLLVVLVLIASSSCALPAEIAGKDPQPSESVSATVEQKPTILKESFDYAGQDSVYFLRVPLDLDPADPAAVILIFHGMGDQPQSMYKAGFSSIADADKVILVYPDLLSHTATDFIRKLLLDLEGKVTIDPARIYAMGFSYGAKLVYHTACEMPDVFAAYAAVSGTAICELPQLPDRAVPILHIHGLGDSLVPFEEGGYGMPPVMDAISFWARFNGCGDAPQVEKDDKITHSVYSHCRDGGAIELYTVEGLGHRVPTLELPAASIIWDFFKDHPYD